MKLAMADMKHADGSVGYLLNIPLIRRISLNARMKKIPKYLYFEISRP